MLALGSLPVMTTNAAHSDSLLSQKRALIAYWIKSLSNQKTLTMYNIC